MAQKREIHIVPEDFQSRLTFIGGVNRYDEPNFKLEWAQYATYIAGGIWTVDEAHFRGYRRLLSGSGEPCWTLYQWHAPSEYGSPEAYYISNYDESSGLQTLGEYPYSGRYEVLYNLRWHEMVDGKLTFFTLPLNNAVFDMVARIVAIAKEVTYERTRAAVEAAKALTDKEQTDEIERHLRDKHIPFAGSSVSFTRQGIRSSLVDKKMLALRSSMSEINAHARTLRPGLQIS